MLNDWIRLCIELGGRTDHAVNCGARKIFRGLTWSIKLDDSLQLHHIGYTKYKMKQLERNYVERDSWEMAQDLWARRLKQGKYGSVGFSCFNHLIKGKSGYGSYWNKVNDKMNGVDPTEPTSLRASVMGPCIQSVTLTLVKKGVIEVDVFYRTTELLKKFPADLVFLRDVLLKPFGVEDATVNFHFANVTLHPMYWITLVPLVKRPVAMFKQLREADPRFHRAAVKWTAMYLCEEHGRGIAKFAQAVRVKDTASALITDGRKILAYLRKNYQQGRTCKNT